MVLAQDEGLASISRSQRFLFLSRELFSATWIEHIIAAELLSTLNRLFQRIFFECSIPAIPPETLPVPDQPDEWFFIMRANFIDNFPSRHKIA